MAKLINIGFGNVVNSQKIVAVVNPDAAPVKRMVQSVKGSNSLVDATQGRKTKSVIVTSDHILILSAIQPDTIARRFAEVIENKGEGMSRGVLAVVSGFSGAGKGTIMKSLMAKYDNYALSVSATTRNPRPGEEDGREYFFRTKEEFEEMIRQDQLIEYARYVENYYGTRKAYVEEQLSAGRDVILEIEIQGARKIKKKFPEAVLVFVTAPSMEELKERLVGRGTETAEVIHQRLARAAQEAEGVDEYDYLLVNDQLEDAVDRLHNIIQSEHFAMRRNLDFIHEIQAQAAKFVEE